jgi:hypothetical protein
MRTHNASITVWTKWNGTTLSAEWDQTVGAELYDHAGDDGACLVLFRNGLGLVEKDKRCYGCSNDWMHWILCLPRQ